MKSRCKALIIRVRLSSLICIHISLLRSQLAGALRYL